MKNVIVSCQYFENAPFLLLENESDVFSYMEKQQELSQQDITAFIKSKGDIDDSILEMAKNSESSISKTSAELARVNGQNPIYLIASQLSKKTCTMLKLLERSNGILVNSAGGYQHFKEDFHTIVSETPFVDNSKEEYITINQNTQYINLENDPFLEKHIIDFLSEKDKNFSYVRNLRSFSIEELTTIFTDFINAGGHTVYVYTTATDIQQMMDYSTAIINSGLKNVVFEFSCTPPNEVQDVVKYLENNNISVSY